MIPMSPTTTEMTKDIQPMQKKTFMKPRKKKKYTTTAVEKAAAKAKTMY